MRILFNIASRQRPKQLFELLDNIFAEATSNDFIVAIKLDYDDPMLGEYLEGLKDYRHIQKVGNSISKIHAINRDIPLEGWDILVNVSDDQRFTVKGFDEIIRKHCDQLSFVHFPDAYKKAACSTMSIFGKGYYDLTGQKIYNDEYYSLWADQEETEKAKLVGYYKYIPITIFEHNHYSNGAYKDSLYKRNDTYKKDKFIYEKRKERNFDLPEIWNPLPFLLIKYPTRGRWRLFAEALDNIYSTIRTNQFKIVVSADTDDVEMNSPEVRDLCKRYHNVELNYNEPGTKIDACNANIDSALAWDWCILMSDDMRFTEFGWDYKMMHDIKEVWPIGTDWFAHFNDGYVGHKLPTMNVCGRQWYDRFGYLYHPSYKSVSCDAENMFVAQMFGRYHYFDTVYFNHDHPANLKQPSDYIYRRNHAYGEADTQNYFARLKQYFGVANPVMVPEQMKPYL